MVRIPLLVKIVLAVVILMIALAIGVFAKMQQEQKKMAPMQTSEVIPGVYAVDNGFVNLYVLKGDAGYLMIDAGNDSKQTSDGLAQLGISPDEIRVVLLTHSDGDHVKSLPLFPDAQVYISAQEVQMIDGTTARSPMGGNKLDAAYQTLGDGQTIELLGFSVQCVATPGHTPGSMCYLLNGDYLFVGDSLSLRDDKAALFNSFFNMDDQTQASSIRMLASTLHPRYIFTAHYGYTDDPDTAFTEWRS